MSAMPPSVLVIGSSNADLVLSCDRLPKPGQTLLGGNFQRFQGGKGANQAVAAARAGAAVTFVGRRGEDDFGASASATLQREGIDVRHFLPTKKISSGVALILLGGKNRENMIAVARSANDLLSPADIARAGKKFAAAGAVICQLETPLPSVREAARLAAQHQIPFILNPAPARTLPAALLKLVHTLTPNEHEAFLLTGKNDPEEAGRALLKKGCRQVVLTLGAKGALLANREMIRRFPAPRVKPVDTVGAGDCFTGWLSVGIAERLPIDLAIQRALWAASLSVTRRGAQPGLPYRWEWNRSQQKS